jgi:transcriptional regulator with XRE-family HTH domain
MAKDRYTKEIEAFGRKIKSIRKSKGLTQLDIALEMGIERSEISKIENGKLNIGFRTMVKLAVALKSEFSEFFTTK